MLPSVLARQLQEGLTDYIDTTFPITNSVFKDSLKNMLETKDAVFHEPYVAVRLPFRVQESETETFQAIHQSYNPYVHQQKAFDRLTGEDGRSTLVATGTGSGKTECFLYPILEYCYRHRGEQGIKALIIYPMNALASDQANRIAKLVESNPELKNNGIRVGMYVGGQEKRATKMMMPDKVITDHETMLAAPPDILLTNYKMLDYLLVRPKDAELWKNNLNPETLKYIAVDELHTFDGAQGTDLACLLRRLKARLNILPGQLCCIGTSATMGAKESADSIRNYAEDVFGESFEEDSVVMEDRLSANEFFADSTVVDFKLPSKEEAYNLLMLSSDEDDIKYLRDAAKSWFDESFIVSDIMSDESRVAIGKQLMQHNFTQNLIAEANGTYMQSDHVVDILRRRYPELTEMGDENAIATLDALYALISHARIYDAKGKVRPFLNVQVQVWMRELRRLVAKVAEKDITFALATDLNENQAKHYLPVVNCRDCGETGWASIMNEQGNVQLPDLTTFYNLFFSGDSKIRMIFPHKPVESAGFMKMMLCPECLDVEFEESKCQLCSNGHKTIPVWIPDLETTGKGRQKNYTCPFCGSKGGLSIMGMRSATAISAGISEIYASKFNDDKKLLAFTDNVQDAAHHAGFYNSRTWRFGLRSAVQRFAMLEEVEYPLSEFKNRCIAYWKNYLGNENFVANFVAPNLTWMRGYERMCQEGFLCNDEDGNSLMDYVTRRLDYEVLLEYGLSARIGRSLEKSGCSTVAFDVDKAIPRIMERIPNELGLLQDADVETFYKLAMGFLYGMKLSGAFTSQVYDSYIKENGKDYLLSNKFRKWMPGVRRGRNVPKFIAINRSGKKMGYYDQADNKSWYGKWINKYLPVMHSESDCFDISKIILEELTNAGVLTKCDGPENIDVWGINSDNCTVSTDVRQMVCDTCGNKISVAGKNAEIWSGICCTRVNCTGHMMESESVGLDFYGKLYSQGEMIRIVAKEHTGLLQRDDREELERIFKKAKEEKKPWDANLLSCTPTLEMGIDIGDLSTVILSSIPPAQAQYAQRAGRGGRKDGNALTVAVANARPHDLYFYEDPMEMIAGAVEPPKVFLRASAVLSRQFVAYCMDCWVKSGIAVIPKNVGACLARLGEAQRDRFPNNFLYYVQTNITKLVRMFIQTFSVNSGSGGLDEDAIKEVRTFAIGDSINKSPMHMKIYDEFFSLKEQRKAIQDSVKSLRAMIKELEAKPKDSSYDEQIKDLKSECIAWMSVIRNMTNKDVFNFLSDVGLLPNYAFPEYGIVLKAVVSKIIQDKSEDGKHKYENKVYEYNRSASSAISEFAPLNSFYAGGRKLKIDQIDLNTAQTAKWRLCPNCSHAELEDSAKAVTVCPECGSPGWADAGQVRPMLRVQMVYSNMRDEDSLIGDESDDRASVFYDKEMLVDVDEDKDIIKAYKMDNDEFSFGYEFVQKATMREINFGEKDIVGNKLSVAGYENVRKGFTICKYCGKIQEEGREPQHTRFCRMKKDNTPLTDPFDECLFLYREFQTEAIRILIPSTTMDTSRVREESFVAAFMLGMKKYFGNVDHLRACVSEVPVLDADYRKQYLVIYDSVPGGTGYLKQLMNNKNGLIEILECALDVMEQCSCKEDLQKDGCYKCLYAYRQSQHIGEISRKSAIHLVKAILSGKGNLEEIEKLGNVDTNHLFDSELERRFIGAFERLGTSEREINIHKKLINSKEGYSLQIDNSLWEIEPQVILDTDNGIVVKSKPDFIIRPKRIPGNQKPVVVFTDGFLYHKDKVDDDTLKRMAIMLSGKYRVWSLTYKDVQNVFQFQGDYKTNSLIPEHMPSGPKIYRPAIKQANAESVKPDKENAFELLVDYLANPNAEDLFSAHAKAYGTSLVDITLMSNQVIYDQWKQEWSLVLRGIDSLYEPAKFGQAIFGQWKPRQSLGNMNMLAGVSLDDMRIKGMNADSTVMAILNDKKDTRTDKYDLDWNGFWHFSNVMQFNPNAYFVSTTGLEKDIYTILGTVTSMIDDDTILPVTTVDVDVSWNDFMSDFIDDIAKTCATEMMKTGIPAPTIVGYELEDESTGAVIAEAEIVWEDRRIVWLLPEQEEYRSIFETHEWKVFVSTDSLDSKSFGGAVNE